MKTQKQVDTENFHIFLYRLMGEFNKVNNEINYHLRKRLPFPRFAVTRKKWGEWDPDQNKLSLCEDLFRNFEWGAVIHVLKHEMAHMIVSELWDIEGRPHGEAFKKACDVVGCDNRRCCSVDFLNGFNGKDHEDPIVSKIRKLMAKGQCESASEHEAEVFMAKAQKLMENHNITNTAVMGTDKLFVRRPVGGKHKRWPTWLWALGDLVCRNYNVDCIRYSYFNHRDLNNYTTLELFGESHNVDVAEYVFHVVQRQAERLYEKHKKDPNRRRGYRKLSKASFMRGLMNGYSERLEEEKAENTFTEEQTAILLSNDRMLKEKFRKEYPNCRHSRVAGPRGDGIEAGAEASKNIRVDKGLNSSKRKQLRLT
jgi:hypothetical protein